MNGKRKLVWAVCGALFAALAVQAGEQDTPAEPEPQPVSKSDLERRIEALERRIEAIERLLTIQIAPSASSVAQAERDLEAATEMLEFKKRLARKGYISPAEVRAAEFAVDVARKKLELARNPSDAATRILELIVLKTEFESERAADELKRVQRLADVGLVSSAEVRAAERAAAEADEKLQAVRRVLERHQQQQKTEPHKTQQQKDQQQKDRQQQGSS